MLFYMLHVHLVHIFYRLKDHSKAESASIFAVRQNLYVALHLFT